MSEHLDWQLNMHDISESTHDAAICIIGNLDEDGRLTAAIDVVAQMSACLPEVAENARQIVMKLDPVGCGAMDVKDCLLAQLDANGVGPHPEMRFYAGDLIQVDMHLRPGHSGGPMVDGRGRVVGINTMINGPNVGLAVPVHVVKAFLQEKIRKQ